MRDFEIPGRYLRTNYEREDWLAVVLIHRSSASLKQEFATAATIASPRYQAYLRSINASGADVYLTVNSLKSSVSNRRKADIENIRHVFLDLDGGGRTAVDRVVKAAGMPNPHHILCTSPDKHQILWSVENFEKDQAEVLAGPWRNGSVPTKLCGMWRGYCASPDSGIISTRSSCIL